MAYPVIVIGGGLSGLAAAIRIARFDQDVLLVEQHSHLGGLNSYFFRNKTLFETGLHAITNYAEPQDKQAPLNRLLRQLKIKRSALSFCPQFQSKILFENCAQLVFSNDIEQLKAEVAQEFPESIDGFCRLLQFIDTFDAFAPSPFRSAREFLQQRLNNPLLCEMLLCPLMYYGSSIQEDMDLGQFVIMFRAIFFEGMFRPQKTIKELLDLLRQHLLFFGGKIRVGERVCRIFQEENGGARVRLASGEELVCSHVLSTIGAEETIRLIDGESGQPFSPSPAARLAFVENIFQIPQHNLPQEAENTIIFFNSGERFSYRQPGSLIDTRSGVLCFPGSFNGVDKQQDDLSEVRTTHLANYDLWNECAAAGKGWYRQQKERCMAQSQRRVEAFAGPFLKNISFADMFTPLTIERYTGKIGGAIYGRPDKIKDGDLGFSNIFLAGTDQGFLGIVGSMLSGVSIVNQHILPKL